MAPHESGSNGMARTFCGSDVVREASSAARLFGEAEWLADDELARLCIIIEELVANVYDHGGVTADQVIELSLASEPGVIRIILVDPGTPFDPRNIPRAHNRVTGGAGAGIDIVRAWAVFVDYRQVEQGNCLELLLPIGTAR